MWAFPTATKEPPCDIIKDFLEKYGNKKSPDKVIRTDLGGELGCSLKFKEAIRSAGFRLETVAPDSPFQIGVVERSYKTLGNMIRAMLKSSGLGSEFWSDALLHAVYLKNRMPHLSLPNKISPFQIWNKQRPNLSHLRVFGSLVYVRTPGVKDGKLDTSRVHKGIFLGFSPTKRNIKYLDLTTNQTKTS